MRDSVIKQIQDQIKALFSSKPNIDDTTADSIISTYSASKIEERLAEIPGGGVEEAPIDGTQYGRQDGEWTEVVAGSFSGTMDDIPDGTTYVKTENNFTDIKDAKLSGIAAGAEVNVNADWNASSGDAQILNKPTIPTSADYEPKYTNVTINDAGTDISGNTNLFINQPSDPATVNIDLTTGSLAAGNKLYVKVILIQSGGSVTLYTHDFLNGTDPDIVLTDADNGSAFILVYDGTYWYEENKYPEDFLSNIVEDTTPQLGGDLDLNGKSITDSAGTPFTITPTELSYLDGISSNIQTQIDNAKTFAVAMAVALG